MNNYDKERLLEKIGENWPQVADWIADSRLPRSRHQDLELAVLFAFEEGQRVGRETDLRLRRENDSRIGTEIRSLFSHKESAKRQELRNKIIKKLEEEEITSEARIEKQLDDLVSNDVDAWKESK